MYISIYTYIIMNTFYSDLCLKKDFRWNNELPAIRLPSSVSECVLYMFALQVAKLNAVWNFE